MSQFSKILIAGEIMHKFSNPPFLWDTLHVPAFQLICNWKNQINTTKVSKLEDSSFGNRPSEDLALHIMS